mmetsp:Transcript_20809/g.49224  ORF Transcript_20809/g.49224 Transcript_20809/m.49224 type:complete len:139 (-) Transcript_20809:144-560(-)
MSLRFLQLKAGTVTTNHQEPRELHPASEERKNIVESTAIAESGANTNAPDQSIEISTRIDRPKTKRHSDEENGATKSTNGEGRRGNPRHRGANRENEIGPKRNADELFEREIWYRFHEPQRLADDGTLCYQGVPMTSR